MRFNAEYIRLITPPTSGSHEKYSHNLSRFMRRRGVKVAERDRVLFAPDNEHPTWCPEASRPENLYIGTADDEGWVYGARLSVVICQGGKAKTWAFVPRTFPMGVIDVTDDFLARYLMHGKCAMDPTHNLYGDRDRFTASDDRKARTCNWCDMAQKLHETTVPAQVWMPAQATA